MKKLVIAFLAAVFVLIPMITVPTMAAIIIPKAEMVFVVDVSGSMSGRIASLKSNVGAFVQELNNRSIEVKLGLITYSDITASPYGDGTLNSTIVHTYNDSVWMDVNGFIVALNRIILLHGGDNPETAIDGLGFLVQEESPIKWSDNTYKFSFLLTDADTKDNSNWTAAQQNTYGPHNRWGYGYISDITADLKSHGIYTSVITLSNFSNHYRPLYEQTSGIFVNLTSNFSEALSLLIDAICKVIFTWTVEFVDWDNTVLDTQEIVDGKAATAPAAPKREGWHFVGWDLDFWNVTSDMTITAQYEINTYSVTFIDWDGETLDIQHVKHGGAAIAPDTLRVGYSFLGWDIDFDNVTEDLIVIALYKANLNNVTPMAYVEKLSGNKNNLYVTVTETYTDDSTIDITKMFVINNNAADTYEVGPYKVYVDTKGNVQIRACYIVE